MATVCDEVIITEVLMRLIAEISVITAEIYWQLYQIFT